MLEILLAIALAGLLPLWIIRHTVRARQIAKTWAQENGCHVEAFLWTAHSISPFPFAAFGKQAIRRVRVRDGTGTVRVAWLLIGDSVLGLLDDRVKNVVWESRPPN